MKQGSRKKQDSKMDQPHLQLCSKILCRQMKGFINESLLCSNVDEFPDTLPEYTWTGTFGRHPGTRFYFLLLSVLLCCRLALLPNLEQTQFFSFGTRK